VGSFRVIGRGTFHADVTTVEFDGLTLQRSVERLPRVAHHALRPNQAGLVCWPSGGPLPVIRGRQMQPGESMFLGRGMDSYHRTIGSTDYTALVVDADELNRISSDLTGRELDLARGRILRPSDRATAELFALTTSAGRMVRTAPHVFGSAEASRAMEHSLLRVMVTCLIDGTPRREPLPNTRRANIMARFEATVEDNLASSLHLPDLCRLVGVPERTLRKCCQQHLGMGPHEYLVLRRIHLARRALLRADPKAATVTEIVTRHGIWELGRFAAVYRSMFGEVPSDTLRRSG
jgi:AraC-like DNA-binding protein